MKGEAVYRPGVDVRLRRFWNRTSAVWTQPTVVIAAVLFMPRGIVSLAMKRNWMPVGRGFFRGLAAARQLEVSRG